MLYLHISCATNSLLANDDEMIFPARNEAGVRLVFLAEKALNGRVSMLAGSHGADST